MKRWQRGGAVILTVCSVLSWSWSKSWTTSIHPQVFVDHVASHEMDREIPVRVLKSTSHRNVVTVVPGFGHTERLPLLNASLRALEQSTDDSVSFECIVYVWNEALLQIATDTLDLCTVEYSHGMWTHHMLAVGTSNATASMIDAATHVILQLDDMDAQSIRLPLLLDFMEEAQLDVAGPSVPDWHYPSIGTRPFCVAHFTGHIDILFTVFTHPMWHCWQNHIDLNINSFGWGYDLTMADVCHARLGIIDAQVAYHSPECAHADKSQCKGSTYDTNAAYWQMYSWLLHAMNLTTVEQAQEFHGHVASVRPLSWPYCHAIRFRWSRLPSDMNAHKGLVGDLSQTGYFVLPVSATPAIALVPVDASFGVSTTPLSEPWVGLMRSSGAPLESNTFQQSASHCVALIVFTTRMAAAVSKQLDTLGAANVAVCTVHHPLPLVESVFDPDTDIKAMLLRTSAVVLVNDERDLRTDVLSLTTRRRKIWLTSPLDSNQWAANATRFKTRVPQDQIPMLDGHGGTKYYTQLVRRNLVVMDGWSAAAAVDTALLALALAAPFFIRKWDASVEYLGDDYPLYFTNVTQVQDLLRDTQLGQRLREAHLYLQQRRPSSNATSDSLVHEMLNCTMNAMAQWKQ